MNSETDLITRKFIWRGLGLLALFGLLAACKSPLAIVGEGDIVDLNNTGFGCTLEQFRTDDPACTENESSGDYIVNYQGVPRPGWRFVRWEGPCGHLSEVPNCRVDSPAAFVALWDKDYSHIPIPTTVAVFEPINTTDTVFRVQLSDIDVRRSSNDAVLEVDTSAVISGDLIFDE